MKSIDIYTLFISISLIGNLGLAKVNAEFTKTTLGRGSPQKGKVAKASKTSKKRRLYLNFTNPQSVAQNTEQEDVQDQYLGIQTRPNPSITKNKSDSAGSEEQKIGFSNELQVGYSNSAYRYAGEEYPAKSIDFGLVPSFETTCFTAKCILAAKIIGGFDLNNHGKNELALFQLGLKFPGEAWGGYLAPSYSLLGYLPATPGEINNDKMIFGYGGAFGLATTPDLMGGEFLAFTGTISLRKNVHEEQLKQQDWSTRQALITDLNFSKTIGASLVFGHIYGSKYDGTENEILELIQSIKWMAAEWLELNLSHGNTRPMFVGDGAQVNTDLVSIDNSVISLGVGITTSF
jgi:hypothetical protein